MVGWWALVLIRCVLVPLNLVANLVANLGSFGWIDFLAPPRAFLWVGAALVACAPIVFFGRVVHDLWNAPASSGTPERS